MSNVGIQLKDKNNNNVYPNPFPVGAIYMSVDSRNPSKIFGGTWERIKGRFLLGADDSSYKVNTTGGEASHQLNINEIPSHNHGVSTNAAFTVANNQGSGISGIPAGVSGWGTYGNAHWYSIWTENNGGNQAHNNMPPYLVVYIWKRVS